MCTTFRLMSLHRISSEIVEFAASFCWYFLWLATVEYNGGDVINEQSGNFESLIFLNYGLGPQHMGATKFQMLQNTKKVNEPRNKRTKNVLDWNLLSTACSVRNKNTILALSETFSTLKLKGIPKYVHVHFAT